jgi:hypothetical protein
MKDAQNGIFFHYITMFTRESVTFQVAVHGLKVEIGK